MHRTLPHRILLALALGAIAGVLGSRALAFPLGELQSHAIERLDVSVPDARTRREIKLNAVLVAPQAAPPWPSVVMPSNCTGLDDDFWRRMAPRFLARGYAVVFLDSFSPRGFTNFCNDKFQMWQEARVVDAVAILARLRSDDRFDPRRIALGGHSNGAVTAFMAAFVQANAVVRTQDLSYAAYFGVGTTCDLSFDAPRLRAPLLLVSGEKDDYTYPEPCIAEAQRLKAAGNEVEMVIVPGANHNMSTSGWVYNPRVQHLPKGIPHMYMLGRDDQGVMQLVLRDGTRTTGREMQAKYGGFLLSKSYGATVGGNWDRFPQVSDAILGFLQRAGFPAP